VTKHTLGRALDEALDAHGGQPGTVEVETHGRKARVEVTDVDRLGVRVRGVRVDREAARDVAEEARALPERLRAHPEKLDPVEVDPKLGGATLRTTPEEVRDGEFTQIDIGRNDVEMRRFKATEGGRDPVDWTVTRGQLRKLVDELDG
jgi:hypothetical protein